MDNPSTIRTTAAVGLTTALFSTGIMFATSYLFLPHLFTLPTAQGTKIFSTVYHEGLKLVVPIVSISLLSFSTASYLSPPGSRARYSYAIAPALLSTGLVYTRLVMMPGINTLVECATSEVQREKIGNASILNLLQAWTNQNYLRAAVSFAGSMLALYELVC